MTLVSVRDTPIESVDATGINTTDAHYDLDVIVLATGFDAMTGALGQDRHRRSRRRSAARRLGATARAPIWASASTDSPTCSSISGPGAPAVLANMVLHAEAHVNWIADAIAYLDDHGYAAHRGHRGRRGRLGRRMRHGGPTRRCSPRPNSWYMGANVPGKPRVFMLFIGGFAVYNDICAEVADAGYKGFDLRQGAVMTGLLDKVVVVTGAARGTGRVHCAAVRRRGRRRHRARCRRRPPTNCAAPQREVESRGRRCVTAFADVARPGRA